MVNEYWLLCCFFFNSKELLSSLEMFTLKSSSDSEWPLGVISGFSISNFSLGFQIVYCRVELVCHILTSCLEVNVVDISLIGANG